MYERELVIFVMLRLGHLGKGKSFIFEVSMEAS